MLAVRTSPQVYLRRADPFDAAALAELRAASLEEMGLLRACARSTFRERARRELWMLLRDERVDAWVLCVDGHVCGCACVVYWERLPYPEGSVHAEIAGVYVAPAQRGNGYASELVAEALAAARGRGARRIVVQPATPGAQLYARFGFAASGQLELSGRATHPTAQRARSQPSAPSRRGSNRRRA